MSEQKTAETMDQQPDILDGYEPEGINSKAIAWTVIGGLVIILAGVFFVRQFSLLEFQQAKIDATTLTGYPTLTETTEDARRTLSKYEVIDFEASTYRIPIDRAMELLVAEAAADTEIQIRR